MPRPSRPWYRTARGRWCVTIDGQLHTLAEGPKDATRDEAHTAYHRLMAGRGEGKSAPRQARAAVGEVAAAYLRECNGRLARDELSRASRDSYADQLQGLVAALGDRPLAALTPRLLDAYLDEHPGWNPTTRHHHAATAKRLTAWAKRQGLVPADPLADYRLPKQRPRRPHVPGPADAATLLAVIPTPEFRDYCRFLLLTGCRPGEAAALTAADVDLESGIAVLGNHKTARRSGRARRIFLPPEAIELCRVQAGRHPDGPLFPNSRGRAWTGQACHRQLSRLRDGGKIPRHVITNGLRHLFATDALEAGESVATVAALLGNTPAMIERTYSRLSDRDDHLRAAVNRVRPGPAGRPARRPASRRKASTVKTRPPGANGAPGGEDGPSRDS